MVALLAKPHSLAASSSMIWFCFKSLFFFSRDLVFALLYIWHFMIGFIIIINKLHLIPVMQGLHCRLTQPTNKHNTLIPSLLPLNLGDVSVFPSLLKIRFNKDNSIQMRQPSFT